MESDLVVLVCSCQQAIIMLDRRLEVMGEQGKEEVICSEYLGTMGFLGRLVMEIM